MTTLTILPLREQDYPHWLPLWQGYLAFYKQSNIDCQTAWQRFLDPQEPMQAYLAWRGNEALGLVHTVRHRSSWTAGDYCYLQDLFVSPEARGHGVGRALIEHVYAEAAAAGCSRVYWLTRQDNTTARRLYDAVADNLGFIQYRKQLHS